MKKPQAIKEIVGVNETVAENIVDDLNEAVKDGNVEIMAKIIYLVGQLAELGRPKLQAVIENNESYILARGKAEKRIVTWKTKIAVDDYVDVYSEVDKKWFESKVLSVDHANDLCRVHYTGWPDKYNEDLVLSNKTVYPVHTFTKRKVVHKRKNITVSEPEAADNQTSASAESITTNETVGDNIVDALQDRASRRRSRAPESAAATAATESATEETATKEQEKKVKPEKDLNDWICGICGLLEAEDGTDLVLCEATCLRSFHTGCMERQQMPGPTNDVDTWFCPDCRLATHKCFICHKRGADFQDVFKCNLATCGKYYHRACLENGNGAFIAPSMTVVKKEVLRVIPLSPDQIPPPSITDISTTATSSEDTRGTPAKNNQSTQNKKATTPVEPRATRGVKLNFKALSSGATSSSSDNSHENEEDENEMHVEVEKEVAAKVKDDTIDYSALQPSTHYKLAKVATENVLNFKCPLHCCFNCFEFYGAKDNTDLNQCIYCPRAFHTKCVVPGSRFNSRCVVCPRHPTEHLPSTEITAKVVTNEYSVFWEQLAIPDVFPDPENVLDNHFKLQKHIKESFSEQPVNFKMISRNDYDFMQNKTLPVGFVPEVACECKITCDQHCLNRILRIECCDLKGSRNDNDSGNICNIGAGCTNRALQQRKYAKTEVFREFQMGFGLRAKEAVADGALIMEYVGEVIDLPEVHRRMTSQRELTPTDRDFYIMELDNGLFVDGKHRGSNSRFINHSCDPNCELQRWVVKGSPRIGIFAVRDILPGEALSYDYQFDTNESEAFKCYCGTAKCRGTMAPTKKNKIKYDAQGRPQSRDERLKLINLGKEKVDTENALENQVEAEWSRSYTGRFVPGDVLNEMKNGPVRASLLAGQSRGVLLCRVVKKGSNFFDRKQLLIKRGPQLRKALYLAEQRDQEQERASKRPRRASAGTTSGNKGRGKGKGKGRGKSTAGRNRQVSEDSGDDSGSGEEAVGLDLDLEA